MLEVIYQHAKFVGAQNSPAAKNVEFSVCWFVRQACDVTLVNDEI